MNNVELATLWNFLDELNTDEIFTGKTATMSVDWEVASVTSNDSSIISDYTNEITKSMSRVVVTSRQRKKANTSRIPKKTATSRSTKKITTARSIVTKKERQRQYDKNWHQKKKKEITDAKRTFVAGLKLLNSLLADRIERTRMVTMTLRLAHAGKDRQKVLDFEKQMQSIEMETKVQLTLNQQAIKYIEQWRTTWAQTKVEHTKFFLRETAPEVEYQIQGLVKLGEKLAEVANELEWSIYQKPRGVWV